MAFESRKRLKDPPPTPLTRLGGQGYALDVVQRRVAKATEKARAHPQIQGRRVTVKPTAAGTLTVSHGLGRRPKGWNIETQRAAAVLVDEDATKRSTRSITLNFSGAGDLDLWVY